MRKKVLVGLRIIVATGVLSIASFISPPALTQEADAEETTESPVFLESTIVGDAAPETAVTIKDLSVPPEELKILVKPLSLEELQTEAAAWFLILKDKVQEITDTEIAIRRGNRVLDLQEDAADAITDAEKQLSAAEEELAETEPGTQAYERAFQKVEEAKEVLDDATDDLEEAIEANQELKEDDQLKETIENAAADEEVGQATELLDEARKSRDEFPADSDEHKTATEKIDALDDVLKDIEKAKEDVDSAVPESEEYTEAQTELERLQKAADDLTDELIELGLVEAPEDAEIETVVTAEDEVDRAAELFEEAQTSLEDLEVGSEEYNVAIETVDALDVALADIEAAQEAVDAADVGSEEYEGATAELELLQESADELADELIELGLVETPESKNNALAELTAELEEEEASEDEEVEAAADDASATESATDIAEEAAAEAEVLVEAAEQLESQTDAENELKNQLVANATKLQGDQTAIIDRFYVVLDELDRKGGDTTSYRSYISAATTFEIDVTDTEGLAVRVWSWMISEEGGLRWAISIVQFTVIFTGSIYLSRFTASTVKNNLARLTSISALFQDFIVMIVGRGTIVVGGLVAVTSLGVSLGPLIAVFGGVSFVLAFALQSNLGNLASGLMLLLYKPFDIGDFVVIPGLGENGFVRKITLANTSFDHYSGKIVTIPNTSVWNASLQNLTPGDDRLIEFLFMISSHDDTEKIKESWERATADHPGIITEKWNMTVPFVSPSSGALMYWCGAWAKKSDFWTVYDEVYTTMMKELKGTGITLGVDKNENMAYMLDNKVISDSLFSSDVNNGSSDRSGPNATSPVPEAVQTSVTPASSDDVDID